jgi:hypothetical protein
MDGLVKAETDAERCTSNSVCPYKKEPNLQFCKLHGNLSAYHQNNRNVHALRLAKWQERVEQLKESPEVKSLRGEIGVLRLLLEGTISRCADDAELLLSSGKISDLVVKLEKLVGSCHKIESTVAIDKSTLIQFAGSVIQIITNHVTDPDVIRKVSEDILKELG